ncbi:hypothetical protein AK812_SmicGene22640 [Symbiodinium microadriaticum]|uniref:Uncharacterized protein n=1 Tax=Symbiodinium microadriaticum TaxID=2951 RepID=A0A1Q9DJD2_SYMMI|nr:hypothetical protein AK812_SmicGene22640 [Symbiodinium microadriaticum]
MAQTAWPAWALAWYSFLCSMALLNLCLAFLFLLRCGKPSEDARPYWYRFSLRWLGAVYILVVAYRSVFPADYPHRYVFWDNMMSSILIHRACATVEELAWVLQIAIIQSFCAAQDLLLVTRLSLLCLFDAVARLMTRVDPKQVHDEKSYQETCWAIAFAIGLPVYVHLLFATYRRSQECHCKKQPAEVGREATCGCFTGLHFAIALTIFCLGYVPYMAAVDVPSYWEAYDVQKLEGIEPNGFKQGVWNAFTYREQTRALSSWQSNLLWKTVYFTLGPWLSLAMMTAPVLPEQAEEKANFESERPSEV